MASEHENVAEILIDIVELLKSDLGQLVTPENDFEGVSAFGAETLCSRVALAVEFTKRDTGFRFRALVENWDSKRIVREMY